MTDLERCKNAIDACDGTKKGIDTCLDVLRPVLSPYYEEGGFDARFTHAFRTTMQMSPKMVALTKPKIKDEVETLLSGVTYAQRVAEQKAEREKQEQEALRRITEYEKQFISTLLTKLGLRKGDALLVRRVGETEPTALVLDKWDLPDNDEDKTDKNEA